MWFRNKIQKIKEVISVKEQKRISQGLTYVTDDRTSFSINGKKQKLAYEFSENISIQNNIKTIDRNWCYYYWDDFFCYWTHACGHREHSEEQVEVII